MIERTVFAISLSRCLTPSSPSEVRFGVAGKDRMIFGPETSCMSISRILSSEHTQSQIHTYDVGKSVLACRLRWRVAWDEQGSPYAAWIVYISKDGERGDSRGRWSIARQPNPRRHRPSRCPSARDTAGRVPRAAKQRRLQNWISGLLHCSSHVSTCPNASCCRALPECATPAVLLSPGTVL